MVSQFGMVVQKAEFAVGVDVKVFCLCNSCRDEETRKHTIKNPQKDERLFEARIDTDTTRQYDERMQG